MPEVQRHDDHMKTTIKSNLSSLPRANLLVGRKDSISRHRKRTQGLLRSLKLGICGQSWLTSKTQKKEFFSKHLCRAKRPKKKMKLFEAKATKGELQSHACHWACHHRAKLVTHKFFGHPFRAACCPPQNIGCQLSAHWL